MVIELRREDVADGLAKLRELERQADLLRVLENDMRRYVAHLQVIYRIPAGYGIRDWAIGFELVETVDVDDGEDSQ